MNNSSILNPKIRTFFLLLVLLASHWPAGLRAQQQETARLRIHDRIYCFEVATTREARKKGLMFRDQLKQDSGMIFVFPREKFLYFYMKNTHVPLDIAFINQDFQIVDIRQMYPEDETRIRSAVEAKYALEVNRGFFNRHGITAGDRVEFVLQVPAAKTAPVQ